MIINSDELRKLQYAELKSSKLSYAESLRIFEALWDEAVTLGILPLEDPLEGIEVDIRIAKILNHV